MKLKLSLLVSGVLAVSGCGGTGSDDLPPSVNLLVNTPAADPVTTIADSSAYNDYGVHDPSILKANVDGQSTYYVFGSHLGVAKTTNLMTWEGVAELIGGDVDTSTLFDTYSTVAAAGIAWSDNFTGSWASDVIQSKADGKYYFYYSHCAQDNPNTVDVRDEICWHRSYIGLATSDNPEGPYTDEGVFLRTGHRTAEEYAQYPQYEGQTVYNPAHDPNGIDPALFYDKDDNLWMTYGSYSGGIYILDMDETTGKPVEGQGYGTRIAGSEGTFSSLEGSYVMYSPESDYYYLFVSFGGFDYRHGYNIRVARSRTPNGPYLDALGNNMAAAWDATANDGAGAWVGGARVDVRVDADGNPTEVISNDLGTKLLGGFAFDSALGDSATAWSYMAPGHNSALYDEELGKHLLFTHTRFPGGNAHAVRVHEMWVNKEGWLVVSPHRYAPVSEGEADPFDIAGDYRLVVQGKDTNTDAHRSVYVTLTEQGRNVIGQANGSYKLFADEPGRIRISVDGTWYEGVVKWQWNVGDERLEPVITAMSVNGESMFAHQLEKKTLAEIATDIGNVIGISEVKVDQLDLATQGTRGAEIVWSSSNEDVVTNDGKVIRPNVGEGDQLISLTGTVTINGESDTFVKDITVFQRSQYNFVAQYSFEGDLSEINAAYPDGQAVTDAYATGTATALYAEGQVGQALNLDGGYGVLLPTSVLDRHTYTISLWLNETENLGFRPAVFAANSQFPERWSSFLPASWNGELMLWSRWDDGPNFPWFDAFTGVVYPDNEWHHVAYAVDNGAVTVFYDGQVVGTGGGLHDFFTVQPEGTILSLGLNFWDTAPAARMMLDEVKIYDDALSAEELQALDLGTAPEEDYFDIAYDSLDLGDLSGVISDLPMETTGQFTAAIVWTSSDEAIVSTKGKVTRPARGLANAEVTLTATVSLNGETNTKQFIATVLAEFAPQPIARFSFDDDLTDSTANFDAGIPIAPGIVSTDSDIAYEEGIKGNALSIAGEFTAGVLLPDNLITDFDYGYAYWVKPRAQTQYTTTFFGWGANEADEILGWASVSPWGTADVDGNTGFWADQDGRYNGDFGVRIANDVWNHIAVSVNNGSFAIYLNGVEVDTGVVPDIYSNRFVTHFSLGTNKFNWDPSYDGLIDELVIYDAPINEEDIAELLEEVDM